VLVENFQPGTLEGWGLGWEQLSAANPRLVMVRISAYGQTGPYSDRPGFARIAHGFAGLAHLAGEPDGPPVIPGSTSLADYMSGLYGVIGILLALRQREASGAGQEIDIALYEPVFRVLDELAPRFARQGWVRGPEGLGTVNACPHGHFECGDGQWVALACTSDKMFERLARVMGRPDLAAPDRFMTTRQRIASRAEVDGLVGAWIRSLPRDEVVGRCVEGEVPCGPINTIADIFADPHYRARGNLVALDEPGLGEVVVPGVVPKLSRTPGRIAALGPALGREFGGLDFFVHGAAFAPAAELSNPFVETSREGFRIALDVSAYSLVALTRAVVPLMEKRGGGSVLTLTYLGSQRVFTNYNVMGVAKAALEASVRYLASDLGPRNIRVNAISAGPIKTLAAAGISGFSNILQVYRDRAMLRRNIELAEVADTAVFLLGPAARAITGDIVYVDAGYHATGI
jgi:crotonobetainyl-CoA:carnitine CoA-transferase CaiB-like acyl-CoA transferase